MPESSLLITRFIEFLETFGKSNAEERREFLEFIKPQERRDLLALADALRKKVAENED